MSDLDEKGLEAAMTAFRKAYIANPVGLGPQSIEAAIRAYEAHKASAVPDEPCAQCGGSGYCEADAGGVCPRCNGGGREASAVPDEAEKWAKLLRSNDVPGRDGAIELDADEARDLADLLEQMAGEIEGLKEALEKAVVRLRITQELAQQLADLKTQSHPLRNE